MNFKGVELLNDARCIVGEGPVWDDKKHRLLMVDIQGKRLRTIDWNNGKAADIIVEQQVGFVVLDRDSNIIAGAEDGVYRVASDGSFSKISHDFIKKGERFNDGKVGPDGNLYLGTFSRDNSAAFYRMDSNGKMFELFDRVGNSNGLDFDTNMGVMYYNDTPTGCTDAFDFDDEMGSLKNRRHVFRYDNGNPDGMTIDSEGNLWTAVWGSSEVLCINPTNGKVVRNIKLPVSQISCCTFAGADLKDLVITTAAHGIHLKDEPLAGATFTIRTDVCGLPVYRI